MHMDLRPYMQRVPFLVHANASLSRAYRLFRTMGLHTLYVGQAKPLVMGVITRKVGTIICFQHQEYCCLPSLHKCFPVYMTTFRMHHQQKLDMPSLRTIQARACQGS